MLRSAAATTKYCLWRSVSKRLLVLFVVVVTVGGPASGQSGSIDVAIAYIRNAHAAHPDLPALLESNATLRADYVAAHLMLSKAAYGHLTTPGDRNKIRDFHRELLEGSATTLGGQWFRVGVPFPKSQPTIALLRDRALRTYKDVLVGESDRLEYVRLAALDTARANLFNKYNLILLDNSALTSRQTDVISTLLDLIRNELHNTGAIGAVALHGTFPAEIGWWDFFGGHGGEINIFEVAPGATGTNPFPAEVPPSRDDLFLSVLAHELNHIVDAFAVARSPLQRAARDALIDEAGCEPLNYLRSILPACFFKEAPQEFFASIANMWFVDSAKTVDVALARFEQGRRSPLKQALFFVDVYSNGTNRSSFYHSDANADVVRTDVQLERDAAGRIVLIGFHGRRVRFTRDASGEVISYQIEAARRRAVRK